MNKQELETYIDLMERTIQDYQWDIEDRDNRIHMLKMNLKEAISIIKTNSTMRDKVFKQTSKEYKRKTRQHMETIEDLKETLKKKLSDDFIFGLGMGLLLSITVIFGTFWVGVGQ